MSPPPVHCDYHYLVTSDPQDVIKYATRADAVAALHQLLAAHEAAGFTTVLEPSGRFRSSHPDGRTTESWIDDANGDIIQAAPASDVSPQAAAASDVSAEGLEIGGVMPTMAYE